MLPTIITRMVGWAVAVFYRVERTGPGLVSGPVLVAANHPNSLIDPLLILGPSRRCLHDYIGGSIVGRS